MKQPTIEQLAQLAASLSEPDCEKSATKAYDLWVACAELLERAELSQARIKSDIIREDALCMRVSIREFCQDQEWLGGKPQARFLDYLGEQAPAEDVNPQLCPRYTWSTLIEDVSGEGIPAPLAAPLVNGFHQWHSAKVSQKRSEAARKRKK